jgi:hypothetical protein
MTPSIGRKVSSTGTRFLRIGSSRAHSFPRPRTATRRARRSTRGRRRGSVDTNGWIDDVFVHDRLTGATTRADLTASGRQPDGFGPWWVGTFPAISGDGRVVAHTGWSDDFTSGDPNGVWTIADTVPPGLSGLELGFQLYGFVATGKVQASNVVAITFQ